MNADHLNSVMPFRALTAAFIVLDATQSLEPHEQVIGTAVLFLQQCKRLGLDISEMIDKAERVSKDADSNYTDHLRALQAYIDNELKVQH